MKIVKYQLPFIILVLFHNAFAKKQDNNWHLINGLSYDSISAVSINVNDSKSYTSEELDNRASEIDKELAIDYNFKLNSINCDTAGNWFLFGNYNGGKLNIIVDENIPNLKIGVCTYEPVIVTFSGPFVGNITDVYYAGFNSAQGNNNCGFPITTSSFVGVSTSLVTVAVTPPVFIISPPNPANILNQPNGFNYGVVCVNTCDQNTYQGGCNTVDQVVDVFQKRFLGSMRGLKIQYCCWSDSIPYRLSSITGKCCDNTLGSASLSYAPGPYYCGSVQLVPSLLGDSSGTFYSNSSGLNINPASGVIDLKSSNPGTYVIVYALSVNCISNLYKDTVVILGGSSSISSITANACSSYTAPWGTVYTQSGIYIDTLTTANGCDSILRINLTINDIPSLNANITADTCAKGNGTVSLTASGGSAPYTYAWSNGAVGNIQTNLKGGSYNITVTDQNGCNSVSQVNVPLTSPPVIKLNISSNSVLEGDTVQLNASGGVNYKWSPTSDLSCSNCPNPIATPLKSTTYTVSGTDQYGCKSDTSVTITIGVLCNEPYVPNGFSPNADDLNDKFYPLSVCPFESYDCLVFNKWGQLIFKTSNPTDKWDGKYNGIDCPSDVYVYLITYKFQAQLSKNVYGSITLFR